MHHTFVCFRLTNIKSNYTIASSRHWFRLEMAVHLSEKSTAGWWYFLNNFHSRLVFSNGIISNWCGVKYLPSSLWYKWHLSWQFICRSFIYSWSIACRRCSNYMYIFILDLTPGFNGLDNDDFLGIWGFGATYNIDFTVRGVATNHKTYLIKYEHNSDVVCFVVAIIW